MFIALDKLHNQGLQQAIAVVPERSIGRSFAVEALTQRLLLGLDSRVAVEPVQRARQRGATHRQVQGRGGQAVPGE
jgi:hypothetical protein